MWCVADLNEEYITRMEDVLALYEKPLSEVEPVVCVDEKPVVLHADVRPARPMRPGQILRRDSEYKRCGTANVFCGVQPKAGRHFTKVTPTRCSPEFADYLLEIAASYPEADTIHLLIRQLKGEEIPRLWRGGSRSLTFTGVHPRNSRREPTKAHVKEKPDGPIGESKSLSMGVQIPRIVYSQMPPPSAV
jgi:hypothetical protein